MNPPQSNDIAALVRRNAVSAAIGAACLIYFGFYVSAVPNVTSLFSFGDALFVYTLRIGGVAMISIALGCLTGRIVFLLLDALASVPIGSGLIVSAVLMMAGGGGFSINFLLYVVFGGMFISAGLRNGRFYAEWKTRAPRPDSFVKTKAVGVAAVPPQPLANNDDPAPFFSQPERVSSEANAQQSEVGRDPVTQIDPDESIPDRDASDSGGFLASFADDGPPPKP